MFDFPIKLFSVKTKLGRASDTGTGDLDNDLTAAAGNISANQMRVFELWTNENPSLSEWLMQPGEETSEVLYFIVLKAEQTKPNTIPLLLIGHGLGDTGSHLSLANNKHFKKIADNNVDNDNVHTCSCTPQGLI